MTISFHSYGVTQPFLFWSLNRWHSCTTYYPVSLTSCTCKLPEHAVNLCLRWPAQNCVLVRYEGLRHPMWVPLKSLGHTSPYTLGTICPKCICYKAASSSCIPWPKKGLAVCNTTYIIKMEFELAPVNIPIVIHERSSFLCLHGYRTLTFVYPREWCAVCRLCFD